MRGKVSDQDLTNYALNELPPSERLYVESMLGVSEECRADVYQMLDLGEMLKEGFEDEETAAKLLLNDDQRTKVLTVPRWSWKAFARQAAAVILVSAGAAFALTRPGVWHQHGAVAKLKQTGEAVGQFVADIGAKGFPRTEQELVARLMNKQSESAPAEWQMVSASPTPAAAVCTPPVIDDVSEMPVANPM